LCVFQSFFPLNSYNIVRKFKRDEESNFSQSFAIFSFINIHNILHIRIISIYCEFGVNDKENSCEKEGNIVLRCKLGLSEEKTNVHEYHKTPASHNAVVKQSRVRQKNKFIQHRDGVSIFLKVDDPIPDRGPISVRLSYYPR